VGIASLHVHNTSPDDCDPGDLVSNAVQEAQKSAARISDEVKCFGFCIEFSNRLQRALRRKGISGTRIRLEAHGRDIADIRGQGAMVGSQIHEGIRVEDTVFDNLNPAGIPFDVWRHSLRFTGDLGTRIPDEFFTFTEF
jgi:hypothetical protein